MFSNFLRQGYSKNVDFENTGLSGLKNKFSFVLESVTVGGGKEISPGLI